jgi:hypothetical protein
MMRLYPSDAYSRRMFAASDVTYSFAETEMLRCWDDFRLSSAAYIVWVQERSFVALGATSATFSGVTACGTECGLATVVVAEALLAKAAVPSAMPTAARTKTPLLAKFICIGIPLSC